jgi:kumamolisin
MVVTVVLRHSGPDIGDALLSGTTSAIPHAEQATSASPEDVAQVVAFAKQHGLTVVEANAAARSVKLQGTREQLEEAFGVKHGPEGSSDAQSSAADITSLPQSLSNVLVAVLGFDQRPIAKHHTSS